MKSNIRIGAYILGIVFGALIANIHTGNLWANIILAGLIAAFGSLIIYLLAEEHNYDN